MRRISGEPRNTWQRDRIRERKRMGYNWKELEKIVICSQLLRMMVDDLSPSAYLRSVKYKLSPRMVAKNNSSAAVFVCNSCFLLLPSGDADSIMSLLHQ